jgi:hypothetical protein
MKKMQIGDIAVTNGKTAQLEFGLWREGLGSSNLPQ